MPVRDFYQKLVAILGEKYEKLTEENWHSPLYSLFAFSLSNLIPKLSVILVLL